MAAVKGKPYGVQSMDEHDDKALSSEQQRKLDQLKIKTRIGDEKYLRSHPEVRLLLQGFVGEVLKQRPENIREFAADYYTNPSLPEKIREQKKVLQATSSKRTANI